MSIPESLRGQLRLPVIGSPLFIVSNPRLVIEQCKAGIVGSFPALNARPAPVLEEWLVQITEELAAFKRQHPERKVAPYAVNQIVHASNDRLASDISLCEKYRVPIQITSLRAPDEVVQSAHSYGGLVYHDVTNVKHAKRALQAGVDGLILVCSGAGGHAGALSPFALLAEVREFYDGTVILSGAIANGSAILATQAMGADFAYMGTRFIATEEANASAEYKQALVDSQAEDIVYTNLFTGVHGNYLRSSIVKAGLDPDALPVADKTKMNFASGGNTKSKAWRDIWGSGQGVADIHEVLPVSALVDRLEAEYTAAWKPELDSRCRERNSGETEQRNMNSTPLRTMLRRSVSPVFFSRHLVLLIAFATAAPAADLLIENVTVVSPELAQPLANRHVLIRDGRIVSVGQQRIAAKADTQKIDGRGKFLTPGLMDSHVHVSDAAGRSAAGR